MPKTDKLFRAGLFLILLAAAGIRLGELHTYGPTPGDDISYLNGIREAYEGLRRVFPEPSPWFILARPFLVANNLTQKTYPGRMAFTSLAKPLYMLKLALIEGPFELNLYWQQFSLAVVGIGIVLVIYLIGRRLFGPTAGLIAALLAALSPWLVRYSTYGVPTGDSLFWLLLALLALISPHRRAFLTGLTVSIAVMFNPTVLILGTLVAVLAAIKLFLEVVESKSKLVRPGLLLARGWLKLGVGLALIPALWEFCNWRYWVMARAPYRPFWTALALTRGDNLEHAQMLPVDSVFWFRLLQATEGWPQLFLWVGALIWLIWFMLKKERKERFPLAAFIGLMAGAIMAATWTGTTQCARHYILAWALGLVAVGGMLAHLLGSFNGRRGRIYSAGSGRACSATTEEGQGRASSTTPVPVWKKKGPRTFIAGLIFLCCLSSVIPRHLRYRYSRQGWYGLSRWISENVPADRLLTPANQPPNMWPDVRRFHNWMELEHLEAERGPTYIVYGDYLAITRGIWDYPYDMFAISQASRAVEMEAYRSGTHLSDPAFIYENEDYYWGFLRQRKEAFDPDVRVIPTADVLACRASIPWSKEAVIAPWQGTGGGRGYNVYLPFVDFSVYSYRSPWLGMGLIGGGILLLLWACWPSRPDLLTFSPRCRTLLALGAIMLTGFVFRSYGLAKFTQMGGDDVEYRVKIDESRASESFRDTGFAKPFIIATQISQLDVNKTITVFAKPFFLLERTLLAFIFSEPIKATHFWTCFQGVLTILIVFFIGCRLGGTPAGLTTAGLWAISPWALTYSTWGLHVAGGVLYLSFGLWAYLNYRSAPAAGRAFIAGLALGVSFMYSSSNLWPVFCVLLIELVGGGYKIWRGPKRMRLIGQRGALGSGLLVPWLGWELLSWSCAQLVKQSYLPFPIILAKALRDNILHASALPVDLLFFWRHLVISEGFLVGIGVSTAALWALVRVIRGKEGESTPILLALFFGIAGVMNYTGGSQVIRHFFPAWLPLTLLAGLAVSRLVRKSSGWKWGIIGLFVILLFTQWDRTQRFRFARWAPDRVRYWGKTHLFVPGRICTLTCQNMSLWPGLIPIANWQQLRIMDSLTPPGVMMYGDYIEISLGSWFYSFPQYYEISEIARRSQGELFRTPSYLSYLPGRFENEFYYWGLFREPFPDFDPAIRILSISNLLKDWDYVRSDRARLNDFWAPTRKPPPMRLPARPDDILRPFMTSRPRPSYRVHLITGLVLLTGLAWLARPRSFPDRVASSQGEMAGKGSG